MRVLIADDDQISRLMLCGMLREWGYQVADFGDGRQAWEALRAPDAPDLAVLDWVMPGMDGVEICRGLRQDPSPTPPYLILLTARDAKADVVAGLDAGANDYLTKPFDRDELRARVGVGRTVVDLQAALSAKVASLQEALGQVKRLQGLLPICSYCKKIRDDQNYWQQLEQYVCTHSEAQFSHGICPDCYRSVVEPELRSFREGQAASQA